MRLLIICRAAPEAAAPRRVDSEGFRALCALEEDGPIAPVTEKKPERLGRPLYAAPGEAARQTAVQLFGEGEILEEPLLRDLPCRPFTDTRRRLPLWLWRLMAWLQRLFGSRRQPETRRESAARADALIEELSKRGGEAILIVPLSFLPVLLDRLRLRGCCYHRSGLFRFQPLERILITGRDLHCGGCQHNCTLANPGCNIGRDKAARQKT